MKHIFSIDQFCEEHGISRATLLNEWRDGRGPTYFEVGKERYITSASALIWLLNRQTNQFQETPRRVETQNS
jgi:hypothetical protein